MPSGLLRGESLIAAIVDPLHIEGISGICQVDDSQIQEDVGKAAAGFRIPLNDVLKTLDDCRAAEFNVPFD